MELVWKTFHVLTSAMKDEPVNKVIFMDEIRFKGLIDTVKLLGCFTTDCKTLPYYKVQSNKPISKSKLLSVISVETPSAQPNTKKYFQMVMSKIILSMAVSCFDTWKVNVKEQHIVSSSRKIPRIIHPTAVNGLIEILPLLSDTNDIIKPGKVDIFVIFLYLLYIYLIFLLLTFNTFYN